MHAGAEGTLEIVEVDDGDLRVGIAPHWPVQQADLIHRLDIRVLGQIELRDADQRLSIFGQQELGTFRLGIAAHRDGHQVVVREIAGRRSADRNIHVRRKVEIRPDLSLDSFARIVWYRKLAGRV